MCGYVLFLDVDTFFSCVVGLVNVVLCVAGLVCRCMLLLWLDDVLFGG